MARPTKQHTYEPKGWRKLFPYYWQLADRLEARDRDMEKQEHRVVDRLFLEMKLQHIKQARGSNTQPHVYVRIDTETRAGAEKTHRLLEARGVRR
jgi:hypothetical protein